MVRKACSFFARGACRNGQACTYSHGGDGAVQNNRSKPCSFFAKGTCKNGNLCPYSHEGVNQGQQPFGQPAFGGNVNSFGTQTTPFGSPQSSFGSQPFGSSASQFGTSQQQQSPFGNVPQQSPFGGHQQQSQFGTPGQQSSSSFGTTQQQSSFGVQQHTQFGAPHQQNSAFSASQQQHTPFGASQQQHTPFGSSQQQQSPFGVSQQSSFGTHTSTSPFGSPIHQPGSSFGKNEPATPFGSSQTPLGASASPFAQSSSSFGVSPSQPVHGNSSPFGAPSAQASPFGQPQPQHQASPFGNVSGTSQLQSPFGSSQPPAAPHQVQPSSPFGAQQVPGTASSPFGVSQTTSFGSEHAPSQSSFGATPVPLTSSGFGSVSASKHGFGSREAASPNPFGAPTSVPNPFGVSQADASVPDTVNFTHIVSQYSRLDTLSQTEIDFFLCSELHLLKKLPWIAKPPPKELCDESLILQEHKTRRQLLRKELGAVQARELFAPSPCVMFILLLWRNVANGGISENRAMSEIELAFDGYEVSSDNGETESTLKQLCTLMHLSVADVAAEWEAWVYNTYPVDAPAPVLDTKGLLALQKHLASQRPAMKESEPGLRLQSQASLSDKDDLVPLRSNKSPVHTPATTRTLSFSQRLSPMSNDAVSQTLNPSIASLFEHTSSDTDFQGQPLKVEPVSEPSWDYPMNVDPLHSHFFNRREVVEETLQHILSGIEGDVGLSSVNRPLHQGSLIGGVICGADSVHQSNCDRRWSQKLGPDTVCLESFHGEPGARIMLNLDNITDCSVFPGQIIVARGACPNVGSSFLVSEIFTGSFEKPTTINQDAPISMMIASGPFTSLSSLDYSLLTTFLNIVKKKSPDVLVINGPFLDIKNKNLIDLESTFEDHFWNVVGIIENGIPETTRLVMSPSVRDVACDNVFPQPAPSDGQWVPNPSVMDISKGNSKITVGSCSDDVLSDLSRSEYSKYDSRFPRDRMQTLVRHILQQKSFYPLYPSPIQSSFNIDWGHHSHSRLDKTPSILVTPSTLSTFAKVVDGVVCINPGYISNSKYAEVSILGLGELPLSACCRVDLMTFQ